MAKFDKDKSEDQSQEAQGLFISLDFRTALQLEFDKAGVAPDKGLLAPMIDNLVQKVIALKLKLEADHGAEFNAA